MAKLLETGAPANAKLLEKHAAEAESEVNRIRDDITKLQAQYDALDGADDRQSQLGAQISMQRKSLVDAYELWFKLSKQVREYDKAVSESRRDGEKLLRADVEEYWRQLMLSIDLAIQSHGINIAQEACRAENPTEFQRANEESWASCKRAQLEAAVRDGKLPEWASL